MKRSQGPPTTVALSEDEIVDDLKFAIVQKFPVGLGRSYDSPDLTLRLRPRPFRPGMNSSSSTATNSAAHQHQHDLVLAPEENVARVIDTYFPGGQKVEEAIAVETPMYMRRSTPIKSPAYNTVDVHHALPEQQGYFPFFPNTGSASEGKPTATPAIMVAEQQQPQSPRMLHTPAPPALPSPAVHQVPHPVTPPAPRRSVSPVKNDEEAHGPNVLANIVPPINVLIVEDNIINQRILQTWMKRRGIKCKVASDGGQAVRDWRGGGFHLVLMDIQLPVMSGIEASKEIRRLERQNHIGVFSDQLTNGVTDEDLLPASFFKSPVIIVALTASSLQSDREEALAVGCNDFLTKPVSLVWLERKVTEVGKRLVICANGSGAVCRRLSTTKDGGSGGARRRQSVPRRNQE